MQQNTELEKLCRREFSKVNGLYLPSDTLRISPVRGGKVINYRANGFCDYKEEEEDNDINNSTWILAGLDSNDEKLGWIEYISVNENFRGRGFGDGMVDAMERVFSNLSRNHVYVISLENIPYWVHKGYTIKDLTYRGERKVAEKFLD